LRYWAAGDSYGGYNEIADKNALANDVLLQRRVSDFGKTIEIINLDFHFYDIRLLIAIYVSDKKADILHIPSLALRKINKNQPK
jgi:hypothetical protein